MSLSTIKPIDLCSSFVTFKPFGLLLSRNDTIPEIAEVNHPQNQILQDHPDRAGRNFGEHPGLILVLDKSFLVVSLTITDHNQ